MLIVVALTALHDLGDWLLFSGICIVLGAGREFRPRAWHLVIVVTGVVAVQSFESVASRKTFAPSHAESLSIDRVLAYGSGQQQLKDGGGSRLWSRSWSSADYTGESIPLDLTLDFNDSTVESQNWFSRETNFMGRVAGGAVFELTGSDSSIWQTYVSSSSLGGRTFVLRGNVALNREVPERLSASCPPVLLRVDSQPWINSCGQQANLSLPSFQLVWTVPKEVAENRLRIEVDAAYLGRAKVALTDFTLHEVVEGKPDRLYGLVPSEIQLELALYSGAGEALHTVFQGVGSRAEPQAISMHMPANVGNIEESDESQLQLRIRIPPGASVGVTPVSLDSPATWVPVPKPSRYGAWMNHPNVLAAVLAPLALLIGVSQGSGRVKVVGLAGLFAVSVLTGSRIGFATLVVAFVLQLPALVDRQRTPTRILSKSRHSLAVLAVLLAVSGALILTDARVVNPVDGNSVSRAAIWSAAARATAASFWTGWGQESTEQLNNQLQLSDNISHAHNWWLELTLRYGIGGLIAGLWLTWGLLKVAMRGMNPYVLSGVLLVLCANTVDISLMTPFPWVCITLLLQAAGSGVPRPVSV